MHWKITALWRGKKVGLRETQRAVTPFSRLAVFVEFFAADRLLRSSAAMPFSLFSQGHRHRKELHGVFTLRGSGSAVLRTRQFAARRRRLGRTEHVWSSRLNCGSCLPSEGSAS